MARRKATTSTKVLNALVPKKEKASRDIQSVSKEFLRHCTIKGLSPDTVKFYEKELKGLLKALHELDVSLDDVRAGQTEDVENWVEYMLKNNRAVSSINARKGVGRTYIDKNTFEGNLYKKSN